MARAGCRGLLVLVLSAALLVAVPAPVSASHGRTWLDPPVGGGRVTAGFFMPSTYGAGHRGVDLAASTATAVGASAHGTVTFAGVVVGRRWVTVDHGDVRTTVGSLATIAVWPGQRVVRGQTLGTVGLAHDGSGRAGVHWSARIGDRYVDPRSAHRLVATLLPGSPSAQLVVRGPPRWAR